MSESVHQVSPLARTGALLTWQATVARIAALDRIGLWVVLRYRGFGYAWRWPSGSKGLDVAVSIASNDKRPDNVEAFAFPQAVEGGSVFVFCRFGVLCDQSDQSVLLAMGKLTKTLEQFTFMKRQLRAVQTHAQIVVERAFLEKALFQAGDNFRVHAAMMIARNLGDTLPHSVW